VAAARRSEGSGSAPPSQKEPSRHRRGPKPVPAIPTRSPSSASVPVKGGRNEQR
jgi:hypothetical protein